MTTDQIVEKLKTWINFKILPNPSSQDQVNDHLFPHMASTFFLMSFWVWLGLLPVLFAIWKELKVDKHYLDLWKNTESGKDGRIDLFFRLGGSLIAYATLIWQ